MARRRIVDLAIGAAIALALIGGSPGRAPALGIPAVGLLQSFVSGPGGK